MTIPLCRWLSGYTRTEHGPISHYRKTEMGLLLTNSKSLARGVNRDLKRPHETLYSVIFFPACCSAVELKYEEVASAMNEQMSCQTSPNIYNSSRCMLR